MEGLKLWSGHGQLSDHLWQRSLQLGTFGDAETHNNKILPTITIELHRHHPRDKVTAVSKYYRGRLVKIINKVWDRRHRDNPKRALWLMQIKHILEGLWHVRYVNVSNFYYEFKWCEEWRKGGSTKTSNIPCLVDSNMSFLTFFTHAFNQNVVLSFYFIMNTSFLFILLCLNLGIDPHFPNH